MVRGGGSQAGAAANAGAAPGAAAAGQGAGNKGGFHPRKVLNELETGELLTPKQLQRAARAITALEVRPQVKGYGRLAGQLKGERETEAKGLGALGTQLQSGVGSVYHNIAQSEAQSLATQQGLANQLNQNTAAITQQGQQNLTAMQGTQTQGVADALAARGAPTGGGAQQELAAAVAAQQANQGANSQAAQQFAAQQGASGSNFLTGLAGSTQMQGGAAVGGIGQTVIGRIAKSNREYGGDIREALAKQAEAKASKGSLFAKNLLGLRGEEQKFLLGKEAVKGERQKQQLAEQEAAQSKKENRQDQSQQKRENSQWAAEFGLKNWEAQHPNAGSSKVAEKRQEIKQDVNEVKSLIATVVGAEGAPKDGQQLNALIGALNSKASANPTLVRKVAQRWFQTHQRASKQGNRGIPGATKTPYVP
jgi:hypothetical protein